MTTIIEKPRNYSKGKIYKIEALNGEPDDIYIGSTTKEFLSQRMTKHRSTYKRWLNGKEYLITSYKLFEKYGVDNCTIILLESVNANSLDELKAREAYHIRNLKCVNKCIPLQTSKEYHVKYYENNIDKIKDYKADYRANNKETLSKINKEYREKNKEKYSIKKKEYTENNKDRLIEYRKTTFECVCGLICTKINKTRHEKSLKHTNFLKSQEPTIV